MSRVCSDWSDLCFDVLRLIFEGLGSKDFRRARSVCKHWYNVSRDCTLPLYPWRILLDEGSTFLCDPGEDKIYKLQLSGFDLSKSSIMASCSSWLLMNDHRHDFLYLLNVFTRETINLPSMELCQERGDEEWEYLIKSTYKRQKITSCPRKYMACCFWINEKTGDYVVAWSHRQNYLFTYKKGDDYWCSLEYIDCVHMAFKEDKLYVYTFYN